MIQWQPRKTFKQVFVPDPNKKLPVTLFAHGYSYELFGLSSDYTRVVANLWATGSQGWQLGLMAPGWLHGCLGLHFAFNRRSWYRQFRFVLFSNEDLAVFENALVGG